MRTSCCFWVSSLHYFICTSSFFGKMLSLPFSEDLTMLLLNNSFFLVLMFNILYHSLLNNNL